MITSALKFQYRIAKRLFSRVLGKRRVTMFGVRTLFFRRGSRPRNTRPKWGTYRLFTGLRYVVLLLALAPLVYYCLAIVSALDFFRRAKKSPSSEPSRLPPISILKPVRGVDREVYENFVSMCELDYPEYEIVFGIAEVDDPVIRLIDRLRQKFPDRSIRLVTGIEQLGACRKTNSLCRLVKEARYDLLVMNDSDVRVEKNYLKDVVAGFIDSHVGVVTALFRSNAGRGFIEKLDALGLPAESAASMLVQRKFAHVDFAYGWTMATTKKHLAEIGGFEAMVNLHSDDFTLGHEVAKRGYRIELMRNPVWMVFPEEGLKQFLKHELRWSVQSKNLRPKGYLGMFFTLGLAWCLVVALLAPTWKIVGAYFLAYLLLRLALAWTVGVWGLQDLLVKRNLWLVPMRDLVSLCVYAASFVTNTVEWRDSHFRVHGPKMVPLTHHGSFK
jgi:ceramide glucosyltransferase